jgi:hypothetical protein
MKRFAKAAVLGVAVILVGWGFIGCSQEPGADYLETNVTSLMRGVPGEKYKLMSPEIVYLSGDVGIMMDSETMMVIEGDGLEAKLKPLMGKDFMLLGEKDGQPYVHFKADGVIADEVFTEITNVASRILPNYRPANDELFEEYTEVDLYEIAFDSKRTIEDELLEQKTIIEGRLVVTEEDGEKRYHVENGDTKVVLEPVNRNLEIFLTLLEKKGGRFVAAGMLTSIRDWDDGTEMDREASHILGDYKVDYLRYGMVAAPNM